MQETSEEEKDLIIRLYQEGWKVTDIAEKSGRCVTTVKKFLRKAGLIVNTSKYHDVDVLWIRRHFPGRDGWSIPEPPEEEQTGPYRKVHPGDKGIRTQYRPDGKFK